MNLDTVGREGPAELPARQTHDYRRNGLTSLYAALEIASGRVIGTDQQTTPGSLRDYAIFPAWWRPCSAPDSGPPRSAR